MTKSKVLNRTLFNFVLMKFAGIGKFSYSMF